MTTSGHKRASDAEAHGGQTQAIVPIAPPPTWSTLEYVTGVILGLVEMVADVIESGRAGSTPPAPHGSRSSALAQLSDALVGISLAASRDASRRLGGVGRMLEDTTGLIACQPLAHSLAEGARRQALDWARRGRRERVRNRLAANDFVRRIAGAVLERVDLDAAAERVSVDRILDRVDLDAVVARLNMTRLTEQFMDEVDLPDIVRESTTTVGTETVNALRVQGMLADGLLSRIADRVLMRRTVGPEEAGEVGRVPAQLADEPDGGTN